MRNSFARIAAPLLSKAAVEDAKLPCRPMATMSAPIKFTPGEKAVRVNQMLDALRRDMSKAKSGS